MKRSWSMLIAVAGVVIVFFSMLAFGSSAPASMRLASKGHPQASIYMTIPLSGRSASVAPTCATSAESACFLRRSQAPITNLPAGLEDRVAGPSSPPTSRGTRPRPAASARPGGPLGDPLSDETRAP